MLAGPQQIELVDDEDGGQMTRSVGGELGLQQLDGLVGRHPVARQLFPDLDVDLIGRRQFHAVDLNQLKVGQVAFALTLSEHADHLVDGGRFARAGHAAHVHAASGRVR